MEVFATKTKPALAFSGVGWIGRNRMRAAAESRLADIILIADPSDQCITEALKIIPHAAASCAFEEIIHNPEIDGIVIATPNALHRQQAVMALEYGKSVFCQKPLGRNAAEVNTILIAAEKANKLLAADFSYRHTAAFKKIYSVIQSGRLGKIFAVDLIFHNAYGPDKEWFYDISQSGGGCVLDLGIHLIDLMLYALEFPKLKAVTASLYKDGIPVKKKKETEDYATVCMSMEKDVQVNLSCSWKLQAGRDAIIEASFYGTEGAVSLKNINGSFYDFKAWRHWGTRSEILEEPPDDWGSKALLNWIQQLAVNSNYNSSAAEYLHSAEIIDRIYDCI